MDPILKKYMGSFERNQGWRVKIQIIVMAFLQNYKRKGMF